MLEPPCQSKLCFGTGDLADSSAKRDAVHLQLPSADATSRSNADVVTDKWRSGQNVFFVFNMIVINDPKMSVVNVIW